MEFSEVKTLLDAGFTADEIRGMMNPDNNPQFPQLNTQEQNIEHSTQSSENNSENPVNNEADQLNNDPGRSPIKPEIPNIPEIEKLNENITKLIRTIQVSNLHNNSLQNNTEADINNKVDAIMASLIRPEHEKGD